MVDRLNRELVAADDLDTLARTLLSGLTQSAPRCCLHGAALGLVEGAGRRLRFLTTENGCQGDAAVPAWTHVDGYADVPHTRVLRTREPMFGPVRALRGTFPDYCRERGEHGTVSLACLPLDPVMAPRDLAAENGPVDRPLGALALYYDGEHEFHGEQRQELAVLARVVSHALRRLAVNGSPHAPVPGDPRGEGAAEAATVLPNTERAPSAARRFLREQLGRWGVDDDVTAVAELCLSELVTNAVIHAGSSSQLLVALIEGALEISVRDHGGPPETHELVARIDDQDSGLRVYGRGLMLVESLSTSWGVEQLADGSSVWFTLDLGQAR